MTLAHPRKRLAIPRRAFNAPYLKTVGYEEKDGVKYPYVWYQLLPAAMSGHHVNPINTGGVWQGLFHCVDCKLMGNRDTFKAYSC